MVCNSKRPLNGLSIHFPTMTLPNCAQSPILSTDARRSTARGNCPKRSPAIRGLPRWRIWKHSSGNRRKSVTTSSSAVAKSIGGSGYYQSLYAELVHVYIQIVVLHRVGFAVSGSCRKFCNNCQRRQFFFQPLRICCSINGSLIFWSSAKRSILERTSAVFGSSSTKGRNRRPRCCECTGRTLRAAPASW